MSCLRTHCIASGESRIRDPFNLKPNTLSLSHRAFQSLNAILFFTNFVAGLHSAVGSGAQLVVLDWGLNGCWFAPHHRRSHCVVSLSKTFYPLFRTGSTQEDPS